MARYEKEYSDSSELNGLLSDLMKSSMGAEFFLADLHVHTPASSDFKFNGEPYKQVSVEMVEAKACELGFIPNDKTALEKWRTGKESDYKDWLMRGILISQARRAGLNIMAITDHDSVAWYREIKKAAKSRCTQSLSPNHGMLLILPGVEITARDDVHVIAIVEPNKVNVLELYLQALEYKRQIGQAVSADAVINEIVDNMGGIAYIPHITQTNTESKDARISLVANERVLAIGVKQDDQMAHYKNIAKEYRRRTPLAIIRDSDAHSAEEVGQNPIWLKMTTPSFEGVKKALKLPAERVSRGRPADILHPHIVGAAFLDSPVGKEKKDWTFIKFSPHLNCFIGARGTGKSTVINWIIAGLQERLHSDEAHVRDWMSSFGRVVVFLDEKGEYFAVDINPCPADRAPIDNRRPISIENWIGVYRQLGAKFIRIKKQEDRCGVLNRFRTVNFLQTDIEERAKNRESWHELVVAFLKESEHGKEYERAYQLQKVAIDLLDRTAFNLSQGVGNFIDELRRGAQTLDSATRELLNCENRFVEDLNACFRNRFMFLVAMKPNKKQIGDLIYQVREGLPSRFSLAQKSYFEEVMHAVLGRETVQTGFLDLLQMTPEQIAEHYMIREFVPDIANVGSVESIKASWAVATVREELLSEKNRWTLRKLLTIAPVLTLKVEHNIKLDETANKRTPQFKSIDHLSTGQKCVAMLNFLMGVAEYLQDQRPLIMDQPEDHLDNRFIFDCLVRDIKHYKGHRQIILSTHNANIPVAADAENIFVMSSDGNSFWVDKNGSVDFERERGATSIVSDVQDILEGGKVAFSNRLYSYGY